jgi:predicted secreted Zn-dependent protease
MLARQMSGRPSRPPAPIAVMALGLTALLVAACLGLPAPATPGPSPSASIAAPSTSGSQPSPPAGSSAPSPSASTAAELLPISGIWRVRKVLRAEDRSGLIDDPAFDEETYTVEAACSDEPCDSLTVTTTPLGLSAPATVIDMARNGAIYASKAQATEGSSCVSAFGDRVDGGAATSSILRLWVATDRPAGSSVASTALHGTIELDVQPTPIGEEAGCEPQAAAFELSGRREEVAVRNPDGSAAGPDAKPPRGAVMVTLPRLTAKVSGAEVKYFSISGDTSIELAGSIARGGVKACGAIDYEWFRGDARPSACTLTRISDTRSSIKTSSSGASCRITDADIRASYTIYLPRWTDPSRVPKRLLDWWRRIVDFIADHEAGHVRIGRDHIRKLNARLVGKRCEDVSSIVRTWVSQHAAAQEAYDMSEYSRPWPQPAAGY